MANGLGRRKCHMPPVQWTNAAWLAPRGFSWTLIGGEGPPVEGPRSKRRFCSGDAPDSLLHRYDCAHGATIFAIGPARDHQRTKGRQTRRPSAIRCHARWPALLPPCCFVADTTRCRTDPARRCRISSLIQSRGWSGSLRPPRQVPAWRASDCILHRLDHRPAFMQTATASIQTTTFRAYRLSAGRTGRRPSLTSKCCLTSESSSVFQALKALIALALSR